MTLQELDRNTEQFMIAELRAEISLVREAKRFYREIREAYEGIKELELEKKNKLEAGIIKKNDDEMLGINGDIEYLYEEIKRLERNAQQCEDAIPDGLRKCFD